MRTIPTIPTAVAVALALGAGGCTTRLAADPGDPDALAFAAAPVLDHDPIPAGGGAVLLTVDGLLPGDSAKFVASSEPGAGPCLAVLGGACVGLLHPKVLGQAVADPTGHAALVATFPSGLTAGQTVALQAAIPRGPGGVDSVLTAVVVTTVDAVDLDGDGVDSATDCDDTDADVHPGADELCDGRDTDCDAATSDDGVVTVGVTNYATIADAAYHAPPDAEIRICAGVYPEAIRFTRGARVVGVDGAEVTTIDAGGTGAPALDLDGAGTYHVEGLTLTGGDSGLRVSQNVDATLIHAVVTGNHAVGNEGGGIRDDSYYWSPASLWIEDVEVSDNVSDWEGGGIHLSSGANTLIDVRLLDNVSGSGGGGVFIGGNALVTTITGCTFHGNQAPGTGMDGGGAILIGNAADDVVVTDSDFGVGATENDTDDVTVYDSSRTASYPWFQDHETFTCSTTTDTCQ
ncbi:MAG: right-handed parallel beta-helix repeat-containing protein [Myxococcota bacterium]